MTRCCFQEAKKQAVSDGISISISNQINFVLSVKGVCWILHQFSTDGNSYASLIPVSPFFVVRHIYAALLFLFSYLTCILKFSISSFFHLFPPHFNVSPSRYNCLPVCLFSFITENRTTTWDPISGIQHMTKYCICFLKTRLPSHVINPASVPSLSATVIWFSACKFYIKEYLCSRSRWGKCILLSIIGLRTRICFSFFSATEKKTEKHLCYSE